MNISNAYLEHAAYCERMAEQHGDAEGKRLRLNESRDWMALAAARDPSLIPWSALQESSHRADSKT